MDDLLERLNERQVPPPPASLKRAVHERVNRALLIQQLVELATHGAIYAGGHFLRALVGVAVHACTGSFPVERPQRRE